MTIKSDISSHQYYKDQYRCGNSKNTRIASTAAVARDEMGHFLDVSALVVKDIDEAEVGEALACREGLALASDLGLQSFVLAIDYSNVMKSIQGDGFGRYGTIILEIKSRRED